jgi:hypothetical protein
MVQEARLEESDAGLAAVTAGWFVVNVRDAAWVTNDHFGAACIFEGDDAGFADVGFTLGVLQDSQAGCTTARPTRKTSSSSPGSAYCSSRTKMGDGPCVIFMTGA